MDLEIIPPGAVTDGHSRPPAADWGPEVSTGGAAPGGAIPLDLTVPQTNQRLCRQGFGTVDCAAGRLRVRAHRRAMDLQDLRVVSATDQSPLTAVEWTRAIGLRPTRIDATDIPLRRLTETSGTAALRTVKPGDSTRITPAAEQWTEE
jgi:hypothetical protein